MTGENMNTVRRETSELLGTRKGILSGASNCY